MFLWPLRSWPASGAGRSRRVARREADVRRLRLSDSRHRLVHAASGLRRIGGPTASTYRGPRYTNFDTGSKIESTLDYSTHPDHSTRSIERATRNKIGTDIGGFPTRQVVSGPMSIPHVFRGRKVGVVRGFYVIRHATTTKYEGWFDAGLGFAPRRYAILVADVQTNFPGDEARHKPPERHCVDLEPASHRRGPARHCHRRNLAPRKVTARVQGGRVVARVTDSLGHPLVRVKVTLWKPGGKPCCFAVTSSTGAFALNVRSAGSGTFQLSVAVGGARPTKTVRIG